MNTSNASKESFSAKKLHPVHLSRDRTFLASSSSNQTSTSPPLTPVTPTGIYVGHSPQLGQVGLQCTGPYLHIYAYEACPLGQAKLNAVTWPQIRKINVHRIGWTAAKFLVTFVPGSRLPERLAFALLINGHCGNSVPSIGPSGSSSSLCFEAVLKEGRQLLADLLARGLLQKRNALFNVYYVPTYGNLPFNCMDKSARPPPVPPPPPPQVDTNGMHHWLPPNLPAGSTPQFFNGAMAAASPAVGMPPISSSSFSNPGHCMSGLAGGLASQTPFQPLYSSSLFPVPPPWLSRSAFLPTAMPAMMSFSQATSLMMSTSSSSTYQPPYLAPEVGQHLQSQIMARLEQLQVEELQRMQQFRRNHRHQQEQQQQSSVKPTPQFNSQLIRPCIHFLSCRRFFLFIFLHFYPDCLLIEQQRF